jgi:YHS domain-containing protein
MKREEIEESEDIERVYSEKGRESLVEDDAIEPWEQGFMEGAEDDGQGAKCRKCGKVLLGPESIIEKEIDGEIYRFCSEECAEKFQEDLKKRED